MPHRPGRRPPTAAARVAPRVLCAVLLGCAAVPAAGQTALSTAPGLTPAMRATLDERVSLTFTGTLRDALMTLRAATGLNLVIGGGLDSPVDAAFTDAPVHEVLDTLLLSRGLGYRPVGEGLVIVPIADLGAGNPLLDTVVLPSPHVPPREALPVVEALLSPEGRAHAMQTGRSVVVTDYPARVDLVRRQLAGLNDAAAAVSAAEAAAANTAPAEAFGGSAGPGRFGPPGAGGVPAAAPDVRVFELRFVPPADMAAAVAPLLGEGGAISPLPGEDRLLVTGTPDRLAAIAAAVAQLDVPRRQVRIRALIYDCAVEDSRRLGLNWDGGLNGRHFDTDGNALQSLAFAGVTAATGSATSGTLAASTLGRYGSLGATLRALNESRDSQLLADPNVVALNHEQATIKIVTEVPYQQLTESALGGAIGTTEFREAGVTLDVIPHISADGTITMVVSPEFSVLTGFTPEQNAPIIDTRQATTTVRVRDRETLVLGGLRQRSRTRTGKSVPRLGDVPVLGRLFRNSGFDVRESELLVFLTPEIVGPEHTGDCREASVARFAQHELERTPVHPEPMGLEVALEADRARDRLPWWDRHRTRQLARRGTVAAGPAGYGPGVCVEDGVCVDGDADPFFHEPGLIAPTFDGPAFPPPPAADPDPFGPAGAPAPRTEPLPPPAPAPRAAAPGTPAPAVPPAFPDVPPAPALIGPG